MLVELTIENVAVIEKASMEFKKGFTCLTGETGAGKSIIIDSINAIMGERISKNVVRTGADKASIVAVFEDLSEDIVFKAKSYGVDISQECIVQRQIMQEGKSSVRINGVPVAANIVKDIFQDAINIHGQHDSQSLLNPAKHIDILDSFGVDENIKLQYINIFNSYAKINSEINQLSQLDKTKKDDLELLQFQVDEISDAEISEEEEQSLKEQRKLIKNSENIITAVTTAYNLLSGTDDFVGTCSYLQEAQSNVDSVKQYSDELLQIVDKLADVADLSQECMYELRNFIDDFDVDISQIDEIEERLDLYYKLKRKYGPEVSDVLQYYTQAKEKLNNIEFAQEKLDKLEAEKQTILIKLEKAANTLTADRKKVFDKLSKEIQKSLEFLNMPNVKLYLTIDKKPFSLSGQDNVEFTIVTNKGESPKPLAKIASGGELSRIMLAIKNVLAEREDTFTLIFDEIDTGVSGAAAMKIGKLLRDTAKHKQVLCVTHSPQIAAFSDNHMYIEKTVRQNATFTSIKSLDSHEHIKEIARIISGENITDISLNNAQEMIETAQNS